MTSEYSPFKSLANFIKQRHSINEQPYILVLGAGASLTSGASSTAKIIDAVVEQNTTDSSRLSSFSDKLSLFYRILDNLSVTERYVILEPHLRSLEPSPGYRSLAKLIKHGYFDLILTTNFDMLLETALNSVGVSASDFTVLVNGQDHDHQIARTLSYSKPRIKILKLHGDLNSRIFAFTPSEVFDFGNLLEESLVRILSRDIIIVGHSLRDDDLNRCIIADGGALWYVNPSSPSPSDFVWRALHARGTPEHVVSGELGRFDEFFEALDENLA